MARSCISNAYSFILTFQEETTYKTDPGAANATLLYFRDESLSLNEGRVQSEAIKSTREPLKIRKDVKDVSGSISLELTHSQGSIYKFALGSNATSTGIAGIYQHTIKIGNPPSFLVNKEFTDLTAVSDTAAYKFNGVKVNSMTWNFTNSGIQTGSIDLIGAKMTPSSSLYDATPTDNGHDPFDITEIAVELDDGTTVAYATSLTVTVENNLDGSLYPIDGTAERKCLPAGWARVSGEGTFLFDTDDLYNRAINFTTSKIKITCTRGTGDGSADNELMEFIIPELKWQPTTPSIAGPGGVQITLPFMAFYDTATEATAYQIRIKDTIASI